MQEDEDLSSTNGLGFLASEDRDFLLSPNGTHVKISELKGKIVGGYFSASWHPPCQHFTAVLTDAYRELLRRNPALEIIFVSSDENPEAFSRHLGSMPWLAVPFSDLSARKSLSRTFNAEGTLPRLVVLQPDDGYTTKEEGPIVEDWVDALYRFGVEAYPFTRSRLDELVEKDRATRENQTLKDLLGNDGRDYLLDCRSVLGRVPVASLTGKTIGLYFSAEWCSPGVKFTSKLASIYEKINRNDEQKRFEVVFVSSDRDQESFESHFRTMTWLALPYDDPNIKTLIRHFDVQRIPSLVILGPDGKTLTENGLNLVNLYEERAYPFTEDRRLSLERETDEESKDLPRFKRHVGHRHELRLVSNGDGGGPYVCCDCDEHGSGWAYLCIDCGYEVHTKCISAVDG